MVQEIVATGITFTIVGIAVGMVIFSRAISKDKPKCPDIPMPEKSQMSMHTIPDSILPRYENPPAPPKTVIIDEDDDSLYNLPPGIKIAVEPKFQIGDIVQLNSGSPNMTVTNCEDGRVSIAWYQDKKKETNQHRVSAERMPQDAFTLVKSKPE